MKAKRDSNPRYRTVSAYTKGLILPTIGNTNPRYRSNKNLDFVIFQDDYCCNSMVGVEDSNPKGVNTPPFNKKAPLGLFLFNNECLRDENLKPSRTEIGKCLLNFCFCIHNKRSRSNNRFINRFSSHK